jgi:phosphatidylserine/phosphatidylglycerophosphate/cardiolipin synthase-like enzyme
LIDLHRCLRRPFFAVMLAVVFFVTPARDALAADQLYFPAVDNVTNVLVQRINAETVRIDMSAWYLTEHSISIALLSRFQAGVQVRLIGDRGSIFEIDPFTKNEFYWLASHGVPIRLRYHPTWYPEIDHWKATIFVGQNRVAFGSANYTPFELAPASSTNYKDEVVLLTDDTTLVNAFKTKFDRYWNDTTNEPESQQGPGPYFRNWNDACTLEPACSDYATQYPSPAPMVINTARLEPDYPLPAEMVWGQGPSFNNRLVQSINAEQTAVDFIIYRLTVDNITQALLTKHQQGVPVRLIIEPSEYVNRKWPEFWITHANVDKLWAAGIPIRKRNHAGLTHMKTLVTSTEATIASSNYAAAWQRDHNYFVPATTKPAIHQALKNRFQTMWNDAAGFAVFAPEPPDEPALASPSSGAAGVPATTSLQWAPAAFATNFDVYLGTSASSLTVVANVQAQLVNNPPATYSWTPATPLAQGTTYFWKVVSRTNATPLNASLVASSPVRSFTTAGTTGPPAPPSNPAPTSGATGVSTTPTLSWQPGAGSTSFNVAFGTANPPPQVAANLTNSSYAPGSLSPSTAYFWRVTGVSPGGSAPGPVWSFTTAAGGGGTPAEVVIYASDVGTRVGWNTVSDSTAAGGIKLSNADAGGSVVAAPAASPAQYFDAAFQAQANTRYRVWLRLRAINDSKFNDSIFVQFSDSVTSSGTPVYRIGTTDGYVINLWTCSTCASVGWGWQRNAYWLADSGDVWFQNSGSHTIRVQIREDGVEIDQIVISPSAFATNPPGPVSNDTTIVPKPGGPPPPALPEVPGSPSPANGATGVATTASLGWTSAGATSFDVRFGTSNPPPQVAAGVASPAYSPTLAANTNYLWQIVARNAQGTTTGPVWSFSTAGSAPPALDEIVIYASDVADGNLQGWTKTADSTSPGGVKLVTPDNGLANTNNPVAAPTQFFDVTFNADPGKTYTIWLRLKALNNSKFNDAVWVQFSDAFANGAPAYPIASTSGLLVNLATDSGAASLNNWGWANGAYWLSQPVTLTFGSASSHTMRIQIREDGVQLDQIVLSHTRYLTSPPGGPTADATIVPKP